jgi:WD repeat-containing protein 26
VLNDVRDITLAKHGHVALVSYENKVRSTNPFHQNVNLYLSWQAPPQLWKLENIRTPNAHTMRLSLRHTYMPSNAVDFAGPSYFGGKDDQLVLCAAKSGDIHIWDRESATLLHHIRAQSLGGDLTCIAWNHALEERDGFMFATGSHDGAVKVWTSPPAPDGIIDRSLRILTSGSSSLSQQPRHGTPDPVVSRSASPTPLFDYDGGGIIVQSPTPIHTAGQDITSALTRESQEQVAAQAGDVRAIAFTPSQALGNMYELERSQQIP